MSLCRRPAKVLFRNRVVATSPDNRRGDFKSL